jgi:hypothetical protein
MLLVSCILLHSVHQPTNTLNKIQEHKHLCFNEIPFSIPIKKCTQSGVISKLWHKFAQLSVYGVAVCLSDLSLVRVWGMGRRYIREQQASSATWSRVYILNERLGWLLFVMCWRKVCFTVKLNLLNHEQKEKVSCLRGKYYQELNMLSSFM